eukprot:TCONS_00017313-protein
MYSDTFINILFIFCYSSARLYPLFNPKVNRTSGKVPIHRKETALTIYTPPSRFGLCSSCSYGNRPTQIANLSTIDFGFEPKEAVYFNSKLVIETYEETFDAKGFLDGLNESGKLSAKVNLEVNDKGASDKNYNDEPSTSSKKDDNSGKKPKTFFDGTVVLTDPVENTGGRIHKKHPSYQPPNAANDDFDYGDSTSWHIDYIGQLFIDFIDFIHEPLSAEVTKYEWFYFPIFEKAGPYLSWFYEEILEPLLDLVLEVDWQGIYNSVLNKLRRLDWMYEPAYENLKAYVFKPIKECINRIDWQNKCSQFVDFCRPYFRAIIAFFRGINYIRAYNRLVDVIHRFEWFYGPVMDYVYSIDYHGYWNKFCNKVEPYLQCVINYLESIDYVGIYDGLKEKICTLEWLYGPAINFFYNIDYQKIGLKICNFFEFYVVPFCDYVIRIDYVGAYNQTTGKINEVGSTFSNTNGTYYVRFMAAMKKIDWNTAYKQYRAFTFKVFTKFIIPAFGCVNDIVLNSIYKPTREYLIGIDWNELFLVFSDMYGPYYRPPLTFAKKVCVAIIPDSISTAFSNYTKNIDYDFLYRILEKHSESNRKLSLKVASVFDYKSLDADDLGDLEDLVELYERITTYLSQINVRESFYSLYNQVSLSQLNALFTDMKVILEDTEKLIELYIALAQFLTICFWINLLWTRFICPPEECYFC